MVPLGTIVTVAAATTNLAARDFNYHGNSVRFTGEKVNGTFTVKDLRISAGQDPQGVNKVGDVHYTTTIQPDADPKFIGLLDIHPPKPAPGFTFTAGRHKTEEVADWWNQQIPPEWNTFNHPADALNFVFIGDLALTVADTGYVRFQDVGLAQGSDDNGSNWWFGGKNCDYLDGNRVACFGTNEGGHGIVVQFTRGGQGQVNDVQVAKIKYVVSY